MRTLAILALLAGVALGGPPALRGIPCWDLEAAKDAAGVLKVVADHGSTLADVRSALGWDFLFLASLGPLAAIIAVASGRRAGGKWETFGAWVALLAFLGACADAVENSALLWALEGHHLRALEYAATVVKFACTPTAGVLALVILGRALFTKKAQAPDLPAPTASAAARPDKTCDVVMKGGITSGVVYPRAVAALAKSYRFVNVGGSSAGAIAASTTAAAEYARANGRAGFDVIDQLPEWLGKEGRLFKLFQPRASTRGLFELFTAFLGNDHLLAKLAKASVALIFNLPFGFLLGLVPGALLLMMSLCSAAPAAGAVGAIGVTGLFVPLMMAAALVLGAVWWLPPNGFGMCSGRLEKHGDVLSDWLARTLDIIAGKDELKDDRKDENGNPKARPLIFADLWTAGEQFETLAERRKAAASRSPTQRNVNFEALTTSLTHGRPYRMPRFGESFFFRRDDLVEVLPETVVAWMVEHAGTSQYKLPEGCLPLPAPHDLPVVFAARLSLSFPVLLSAVKLYSIDRTRKENRFLKKGDEPKVEPVWMSDGGIASNFPIHFFDTPVPEHPTFGLDLQPFPLGKKLDLTNEAANILLPENNREGFEDDWNRFSGLVGFGGALLDALQAFLDNMQAHAPGFRDRIARIYLDDAEGGLNLNMPTQVLERLGNRGQAAGAAIVERFVNAKQKNGWDNHRWVRLRLLLGRLDPFLRQFADVMQTYGIPKPEPSYELTAAELPIAQKVIADLKTLGDYLNQQKVELDEGAPRPVPELRIVPRV
jgi:predicted acylesterase/phospholipase RssA